MPRKVIKPTEKELKERKAIVKDLNTPKKEKPKKKQRYVHVNNIEKRKALGWKVIKTDVRDSRGKVLGVRTNSSELVLMEK